MRVVVSGQWLVASEEALRLGLRADARAWSLVPDPSSLPTAHCPPTTDHSSPATSHQPLATRRLRRRGLSLLEVLFSMGILLVGLMGVAAMIPAGRHEILQGTKVDHATSVGRAAFRDLKIREYLEPERWVDSANTDIYFAPDLSHSTPWFSSAYNTNTTANQDVTPAVAFDPLGLGDPTDTTRTFGPVFPYGAPAALYLPRIFPDRQFRGNPANAPLLADPIFRNADDLAFQPNSNLKDGSPEQMLFVPYGSGFQTKPVSLVSPGTALKRLGTGDYSWLATVVTDPAASALNSPVTVSVAVFHKRDLSTPGAGESIRTVTAMPAGNLGGGEITIASPAGLKPVKPGAWIMLAGSSNQTGPPSFTAKYYRWYRVVAADAIDLNTNTQSLTLAGADWNVPFGSTTAWLFDNIIAVYEKNLRLDFE